ncbi:MAG: hypothetical protein IJ860_00220 [Eubacterium sp.]|nr:hypothetical protein [Eubacterium sp.]
MNPDYILIACVVIAAVAGIWGIRLDRSSRKPDEKNASDNKTADNTTAKKS